MLRPRRACGPALLTSDALLWPTSRKFSVHERATVQVGVALRREWPVVERAKTAGAVKATARSRLASTLPQSLLRIRVLNSRAGLGAQRLTGTADPETPRRASAAPKPERRSVQSHRWKSRGQTAESAPSGACTVR